ncbi:unnamed protein product [Nezara viridula]|uniref:Uncharacterized protein n=1 Tax=Nezara viridula TaxID=85310 RepID=A0A9P0HMP3_NEZVI|nr:unnamed protein product [Nezara viridula]
MLENTGYCQDTIAIMASRFEDFTKVYGDTVDISVLVAGGRDVGASTTSKDSNYYLEEGRLLAKTRQIVSHASPPGAFEDVPAERVSPPSCSSLGGY